MGVGVSGAGARRAPAQAPQPACAPGRPPARPPAQPARARGIVRWNTAPSSPRRGGKTPWCSPSKVGAQLPKTLRRPPGEEGRENPAGPGVGQPRRTRRHPDPRGGARTRPGLPAPSGRVSSAQLSPVGPPLPPGGRDSGGARRARPPAPPPPGPRLWSGHFSPPPHRGAPVRPSGGPRGGNGVWGGPELERRRQPSSHAGPRARAAGAVGRGGARGLGAKFTGPRRGRRWGEGSGRGHRWARDSGGSAEPTSPTRGPSGAPPCPVRSPGAAAARTHRAAFV